MRDIEIRSELVRELRRQHADPVENRIWSEFGLCLGASRVDICLINGALSGFEIKSPRDNLSRLPAQVNYYGQVMDYACAVSSEKHGRRLATLVPDWWGLLTAHETERGVQLIWERQPARNLSVDPLSLAQLLWRDEALQVLRNRDLHHGLSKGTRWEVWDRIVEHLPVADISDVVRRALKARPARQADEQLMLDGEKSQSLAT